MRRDVRNAVLTISGGTGTAVEVRLGDGDISWTENTPRIYGMNQGEIYDVRYGDDAPCEISFGFIWEELYASSTEVTVYEALQIPTGWNTSTDLCSPPAIDLILTFPQCPVGTGAATNPGQEVITFSDFRPETLGPGLRDGQISVTGKIPTAKPTIAWTIHTT